jgi:hypothetical protein
MSLLLHLLMMVTFNFLVCGLHRNKMTVCCLICYAEYDCRETDD